MRIKSKSTQSICKPLYELLTLLNLTELKMYKTSDRIYYKLSFICDTKYKFYHDQIKAFVPGKRNS